jgi:hypothetical protein
LVGGAGVSLQRQQRAESHGFRILPVYGSLSFGSKYHENF